MDWFEVLFPHLSSHLVSDRWLGRLRGLWRQFPAGSLAVIEVRLGGGVRRVDVSVRLASLGDAKAAVARWLPDHQRTFLHRWHRDPSFLAPGRVPALWLEFDLDVERGRWRVPLLCARLEGRTDPAWLTAVLFPAMRGRPLGPSQARLVGRALEGLPPEAHLLYAFDLEPRLPSVVRLEVAGLDPGDMTGYLARVAARGLASRMEALAPLVAGADRYHLSLDLADEILPRFGVECGWRRLPHREPRWARFLDRLVARGLASGPERDALLAWPGYDSLRTAAESWPDEAVPLGGHLVRCLSHLKLVSVPGSGPRAKAYLLFQHLAARAPQDDETAASSARGPAVRASACPT